MNAKKSTRPTAEIESPVSLVQMPDWYAEFLDGLKKQIQTTHIKAVLAASREMICLYWDIGTSILEQQRNADWGAKIIQRLAEDLRREFPDIKGFSYRNLHYIRAFAQAWPDRQIVQQLAAQIPWFHNCVLLDKLSSQNERIWYIQKTIEYGWSRNILELQIESNLYKRQGKAVTNFGHTLPSPQSDLAQQMTKDPYVFDFVVMRDKYNERMLEQSLVDHIQQFLLELGAGFALVGRQVHLEIGREDFYIDLLFYHLELRCYVVIELKAQPFKPEFAGKMNFYLSAVDDLLRKPSDGPTIGLILCKTRNKVIAEYALRDIHKPVGVSGYVTKLLDSLPDELREALPSPEQIEAEFAQNRTKLPDAPSAQTPKKKKFRKKAAPVKMKKRVQKAD